MLKKRVSYRIKFHWLHFSTKCAIIDIGRNQIGQGQGDYRQVQRTAKSEQRTKERRHQRDFGRALREAEAHADAGDERRVRTRS